MSVSDYFCPMQQTSKRDQWWEFGEEESDPRSLPSSVGQVGIHMAEELRTSPREGLP